MTSSSSETHGRILRAVPLLPVLLLSLLVSLPISSATAGIALGDTPSAAESSPRAIGSERLEQLIEEEWQARLREFPLFASSVGEHRYSDRLPDDSPEGYARRKALWLEFVERVEALPVESLTDSERIHHRILRDQLRTRIEDHRFHAEQIPFNADSGFHSAFARLPSNSRFQSVEDYENYLARLVDWPRWVDEQIEQMRRGLRRRMTQPQEILDGIEDSMTAHIVESARESIFWAPLDRFPKSVGHEERAELERAAQRAIEDDVIPGYRRLAQFMVNDYIPAARPTLGAHDLPDGEAYYKSQIRKYTTLELTPREIHEIGRAEVARIRGEMADVITEVGFEGSFEDFLAHLRTDPRFYAKTPGELLREAAYISKRMDGKLPSLFKTLPRTPYTVEPVPDDIAPRYTAGRYVSAPYGSTEPGRYWVNTYALETRPLYNLEALSLHEAVPGHHLQGALTRELESLPNFRRFSYISAFGEGWGLYSEWLGLEAGFYTDPYSNFGRLTYEMWRACRLVVDTGVHALGWSRQEVMDYMAGHTALSLHEIRTETDRYISWPGQALAYKLGELKIKELRKRAEEALADNFDVREFHDAVLQNGSIPLDLLEEEIDRWIAMTASETKPDA